MVDTPGGAAAAPARDRVAQVARVLDGVPGVAAVHTPADPGGRALVAADGRSALVTATLRASADEADVVARATHRLAPVPGVTLGGSAVAGEQIGDQVNSDLGRAELLAFPLLALLALVFFRGARAAALPLMVGGLAVVSSFLTIRVIDGFYGLSVYSLNVVFGLGLGLAIDYALFLVSRFREELGAGREVPDAVRIAMATAGRTVVFSALTVAAAMLSLVVFPQQFLKSIGIGGAVVAVIAATAALTILPALFARMGTKLMPRGGVPNPAETRWARITATVLRRPGAVAAATAIVMVLVAVPTLRAQWTGVDAGILPTSHSARVVDDRLAADYPRLSADPVVIAVHAPRRRARGRRALRGEHRARRRRARRVRPGAPRRLDLADRRRRPRLAAGRARAGRGEGDPRAAAALPRPRSAATRRASPTATPRSPPACRSRWPSSSRPRSCCCGS